VRLDRVSVVGLKMDDADPSEEPNLNTGTPWSSGDDQDIRRALDHNQPVEEIADFLYRTPSEVCQRMAEIAEADGIGDPSLLRDGMTDRDRTALDTYRDPRAAMALIREAVEDCAPHVGRAAITLRSAAGSSIASPPLRLHSLT
jgi:hypothetical protein